MKENDLVRLHKDSRYRSMLPEPDAVGVLTSTDGLRCWVQYNDPPAYAAGWPRGEFVKVGTRLGWELGKVPDACLDDD